MSNPNLDYYDFTKFEFKLSYDELFDDWFVMNIFGEANVKIHRSKFVRKLAKKEKLEYLFDPFALRSKFRKT